MGSAASTSSPLDRVVCRTSTPSANCQQPVSRSPGRTRLPILSWVVNDMVPSADRVTSAVYCPDTPGGRVFDCQTPARFWPGAAGVHVGATGAAGAAEAADEAEEGAPWRAAHPATTSTAPAAPTRRNHN